MEIVTFEWIINWAALASVTGFAALAGLFIERGRRQHTLAPVRVRR